MPAAIMTNKERFQQLYSVDRKDLDRLFELVNTI